MGDEIIKKNEDLKLYLDDFIEYLNDKYDIEVSDYAVLCELGYNIFMFKNKIEILKEMLSDNAKISNVDKKAEELSVNFVTFNEKIKTKDKGNSWYDLLVKELDR